MGGAAVRTAYPVELFYFLKNWQQYIFVKFDSFTIISSQMAGWQKAFPQRLCQHQ